MVNASDQEYNDQSVPVGTVVSRRVVSSIPEGMDEGAPMTPQQVGAQHKRSDDDRVSAAAIGIVVVLALQRDVAKV